MFFEIKLTNPLAKAYLQLVVLDSANKPIHAERKYLDSLAFGGWQQLKIDYVAPQDGVLTVNVVNSSERTAAYFDNLSITNDPPAIVQENHYDPWGWNLIGIEIEGNPEHKWQFQGQEKIEDLGLNYVHFKWRLHDPATGRFISIDPLSEKYVHNSTFAFSENKVTTHIELEGLEAVPVYPNPAGELFSALGMKHNPSPEESFDLGKKITILATKVALTVSLMVAPIEEIAITGLAALGLKAEGFLAKESVMATTLEAKEVAIGGQAGKNAADLDKLNRSLASESQMAEQGNVIAGNGSNKPLRKANDMAQQYGGSPSDYAKKSSSSYKANDGTNIETHYEENMRTGEKFNAKTKINNEQAPAVPGWRYQQKLDKIK